MKRLIVIALAALLIAAGTVVYKNEAVRQAILGVGEKAQEIIVTEPLKYFSNRDIADTNLTIAGVLLQTNAARTESGLPALTLNAKLSTAAAVKVDDMFARQYFAHDSPTGKGASDLAEEADYKYIVVGENLALGNFKDDAELVTAWMNSPGHRANILHTKFTEIGISVKKSTYEGRVVWMAVQEFGVPGSVCPDPSVSLKQKIDAQKRQLDTLEAEIKALKQEIDTHSTKRGAEYEQMVSRYNKLVAEFNPFVVSTKDLISGYNAQVTAYNACIARY